MHEWLIDRLARLHTERGQQLAIIAPRGGAKTTWISKAFPLYCIAHEIEPYIMLISDTAIQAEKNLAAIRSELEANESLANDYPHAVGAGSSWTNQRIETRNGVCVEAIGRGTRVRGRTFGRHRPTLIIVDDIDNDESVQSPQQRAKSLNWLLRAVIPAGTKQTNIFVLGTALHRDDVLQNLSKTPGWECRSFPALLQEPTRRDLWQQWERLYRRTSEHHQLESVSEVSPSAPGGVPPLMPPPSAAARAFYERHRQQMDEGALLLWPDREPLYDLMCLRATIGEAAFQAEKQGNPTSTTTAEWPDDCFGPTIWFSEWPEMFLRVIALDPSKGNSETSDFSAFVMAGLGQDGLIYVDADLARRDTTQIVRDGLKLAKCFRPDGFSVEVNAFQELLKEQLATESAKSGWELPLYSTTNASNKRVRLRTLTPLIRGSRFRFKAGSRGAQMLVDQLREFPTGRYDDGPDALEMAVRLLRHLLESEGEDDNNVETLVTT